MKILCFGSMNIDHIYRVDHFVEAGETLSSFRMDDYAGGKGLNQAIALAKANAPVYQAGAIGRDGWFLVELMKEAGVNTQNVQILENVPTGHAIIQTNPQGENCILLYGGANQAISIKQIESTLEQFEPGDYLLVQNEVNHLCELIEMAKNKGMTVVLNPSPMNAIIKELPFQKIDWLILNEIEAAQLLDQVMENEKEMLDALLEKYPTLKVVLTLGKKGAVYAKQDTRIMKEAYPVRAVDTTGAGDTFTGFFLGGILADKTVEQALDLASKAASIAVTRPGAAPSIPTLDEVLN